ncbi:DHH family phosphoesterase [Patescibacteria group bacterium]|nr:DHH family phosphoesterase [Patescibacteria group bacterium]
MTYQEKLKLAYDKIIGANNILLISHLSPDADAISSVAGLIEVLKEKNKKFSAFALGKKADAYNFIPNEELISSEAPKSLNDFDIVVVFDCGSLARTGIETEIRDSLEIRRQSGIKKFPYFIEIDHHEKIDDWADLEIRRQDKASTSAMVYDLLKAGDYQINKNVSECVLSGLMADTGCFLYSNATSKTVALASEMLNQGASFNKILRATTKNSNLLSLKIWGRAIENLHFNQETGLVSSGLTEIEIKELETISEENENLIADLFGIIVSFLSSLKGVKVALLLREENGLIKGSLRSNNSEIDVAKIAGQFGGGGHKKAAGFSLAGKLIRTDRGWKVRRS